MTYSIKYKKVGSFFWTKIKGVVSDGLLTPRLGDQITLLNCRWFALKSGERIEIPLDNIVFIFDENRAELLASQEQMRQQIKKEQVEPKNLTNKENSEKRKQATNERSDK